MFRPAVKQESKLRLAIAGPSGSGKTYTALSVGTALAADGQNRIAVVDTEHGSASKYADIFEFDVVNFNGPYHPSRFVEAIHFAEDAGYDVLVIDSISHAWNGAGGLLEIVDTATKKFKGNSYMAWSEGTPLQNRLVEAIVGCKIHIIVTMRSKQDYVLIERNGKQVPQKVGMAPIQRDGFEYEFDLFLDMDIENNAIVSKTRYPALAGAVITRPGAGLAQTLLDWLDGVPPPTNEELTKEALGADNLASFIWAAYRIDDVSRVLETEQRLADWYDYVLGAFDPDFNGDMIDVLLQYIKDILDGKKVRDAAKDARQAIQKRIKGEGPVPDRSEESTG